jgi:hypothetical protein
MVFVPSAMPCARCGANGVAYPVDMPVGVAFACPVCTPPWLDNFMLWKLDEKRVAAGLEPLSPDDLPDSIVMEFGPRDARDALPSIHGGAIGCGS